LHVSGPCQASLVRPQIEQKTVSLDRSSAMPIADFPATDALGLLKLLLIGP
jgi:hypothetical protein